MTNKIYTIINGLCTCKKEARAKLLEQILNNESEETLVAYSEEKKQPKGFYPWKENDYIGLNVIDVIISEYWDILENNPKYIYAILNKISPQYLCGLYMHLRTAGKSLVKVMQGKELTALYKYWDGFKHPISSWRKYETDYHLEFIHKITTTSSLLGKCEEVIKQYYTVPLRKDAANFEECDPYNKQKLAMCRNEHGPYHAARVVLNLRMAIKIIGRDNIIWPPSKKPITAKQIELVTLAMCYHDSARLAERHDFWDALSVANFTKDMLLAGYDPRDVWFVASCLINKDNADLAQKNDIIKLINFGDALEIMRVVETKPKPQSKSNFDPTRIFLHEKFKGNNNYFYKHYHAYIHFCACDHTVLNYKSNSDMEVGKALREKQLGEANYDAIRSSLALFERFKIQEISRKIQRRLEDNGVDITLTSIVDIVKKADVRCKQCAYKNISEIPMHVYLMGKELIKKITDKIYTDHLPEFQQLHIKQNAKQNVSSSSQSSQSGFQEILEIFNGKISASRIVIRTTYPENEQKHIDQHVPYAQRQQQKFHFGKYNTEWLIPGTIVRANQDNSVFKKGNLAYVVCIAEQRDVYMFNSINVCSDTRLQSFNKGALYGDGWVSGHSLKDEQAHFEKTKVTGSEDFATKNKIWNEVLLYPYPRVVGIGVDVSDKGEPINPKQCIEALCLAVFYKSQSCSQIMRDKLLYIGIHSTKGIIEIHCGDLIKACFSYLCNDPLCFFDDVFFKSASEVRGDILRIFAKIAQEQKINISLMLNRIIHNKQADIKQIASIFNIPEYKINLYTKLSKAIEAYHNLFLSSKSSGRQRKKSRAQISLLMQRPKVNGVYISDADYKVYINDLRIIAKSEVKDISGILLAIAGEDKHTEALNILLLETEKKDEPYPYLLGKIYQADKDVDQLIISHLKELAETVVPREENVTLLAKAIIKKATNMPSIFEGVAKQNLPILQRQLIIELCRSPKAEDQEMARSVAIKYKDQSAIKIFLQQQGWSEIYIAEFLRNNPSVDFVKNLQNCNEKRLEDLKIRIDSIIAVITHLISKQKFDANKFGFFVQNGSCCLCNVKTVASSSSSGLKKLGSFFSSEQVNRFMLLVKHVDINALNICSAETVFTDLKNFLSTCCLEAVIKKIIDHFFPFLKSSSHGSGGNFFENLKIAIGGKHDAIKGYKQFCSIVSCLDLNCGQSILDTIDCLYDFIRDNGSEQLLASCKEGALTLSNYLMDENAPIPSEVMRFRRPEAVVEPVMQSVAAVTL